MLGAQSELQTALAANRIVLCREGLRQIRTNPKRTAGTVGISVDVELRPELNQIASFQFRQFFSFSGGTASSITCQHFLSNLRGSLLVNHAALHHEADVLQSSNILQRITRHCDHIREIARLQRSNLPVPAQQFRAVHQIRLQHRQR